MDCNTKLVRINNKEPIEIKQKKQTVKRGMKNIEWKNHWYNMPEFNVDFKDEVYAKVEFYFDNCDLDYIKELFEQNVTERSTSLWYPKLEFGIYRK